jgi:hypothetical protein
MQGSAWRVASGRSLSRSVTFGSQPETAHGLFRLVPSRSRLLWYAHVRLGRARPGRLGFG